MILCWMFSVGLLCDKTSHNPLQTFYLINSHLVEYPGSDKRNITHESKMACDFC